MQRALVDNAADPKQVGNAEKTVKRRRERELADLREVMSTPAGRRFVWKTLGHCQVFSSVVGDGVNLLQYRAGKQDVGHYLMAEVLEAGEENYLLMQREAYLADKRQDSTIDAMRTPSILDEESKAETQDDEGADAP